MGSLLQPKAGTSERSRVFQSAGGWCVGSEEETLAAHHSVHFRMILRKRATIVTAH